MLLHKMSSCSFSLFFSLSHCMILPLTALWSYYLLVDLFHAFIFFTRDRSECSCMFKLPIGINKTKFIKMSCPSYNYSMRDLSIC